MACRRRARPARPASCVATITVVPRSAARRARMSITSAPVLESRFPVGSSAKITRGSTESARAIATRCCSPPESCDGRWVARWARPTSASSASPRRRESTVEKPAGASFASMFSSAVSVGIRLNCWKTNPNERRRSSERSASRSWARSRSSKTTRPLEGRSSAPSSCSSVVFPDPLGPSSARNSPGSMLRLDVLERVDDEGAARRTTCRRRRARTGSFDSPQGVGGAERAARRAPAAPASSPPRTARQEAAEQDREADGGGERDRVRGRARRLLDAEDGSRRGGGAGGERRPEAADEEGRARRRARRRGSLRARPGRATRPRPGGRPCPASSRAPSACRARGHACRRTRARAAPRAGTRRLRRRSRARARGCARGRLRRRASR